MNNSIIHFDIAGPDEGSASALIPIRRTTLRSTWQFRDRSRAPRIRQ